jgi:branched-chain amino acid transport system substrate-binding protein
VRTQSLAKIAVVSVVGVLALTACSNSKKSGTGLSGGGSSAATGGGTYTVAFEGPLSGDNQQLGINEVNAAELAVNQANAKGDLGFTLKLLKADDVGDPSKAPAAAAQVLQDNTVMGVIGPSFSGATKAVGNIYGDAGLAVITPSASNGTLQTLGFKTFHRIIPNDNVEGTQGADWLARKGLKKVFVVDDQSDYGKGVADAVQSELKAKGVTVTRSSVDAKTTDYGAAAQSVKSSGAGALFYGGYDAQAALFAKALKAVNYTGITAGGNGVKSSVFTKGAGDAGNGWYFTCGCLDATIAANAKQFTADYTKAYNTPPSTYSPEAFDATNALIQAIKDAKGKGAVTKASVLAAVNAVDYQGITTEVKFGQDGEPAGATTVSLYTQKAGQIVSVGLLKDQS